MVLMSNIVESKMEEKSNMNGLFTLNIKKYHTSTGTTKQKQMILQRFYSQFFLKYKAYSQQKQKESLRENIFI